MQLNDYQKETLLTLQPGADMLYVFTKLMIESSESAQMVIKNVYHQAPLDRDKVIEELGDSLYYLSVATSLLGFDLETAAQRNIEKIRIRHGLSYNPNFYRNGI